MINALFMQACHLRKQYIEMENFIEIFMLLIALFTPFVWVIALKQPFALSKFTDSYLFIVHLSHKERTSN